MRRVHLPEDEVVFRQVWEWIQQRPRVYAALGGALDWEEFQARAMRPVQADFAYWLDGLHSLVTTEMQQPGEFVLHVMSRPKAQPQNVVQAVYTVGWKLFDNLGAVRLLAYVPGFHHGSRRLVEACGMRFVEQQDEPGQRLKWNVFAMDRDEFLRNHQHGKRS